MARIALFEFLPFFFSLVLSEFHLECMPVLIQYLLPILCVGCVLVWNRLLIFISLIRKYLLKMKMIHHLIEAFLQCSCMQALFRFCREAKEMTEVMWFSLLIKGSRKGKCVSGENCVSAGRWPCSRTQQACVWFLNPIRWQEKTNFQKLSSEH